MNTTKANIIDENNMKFNYFKLLVDTNKINLSADLVVAKIKPKFNTFVSTSYFLNNILNIVFTKQLLFNFSRNVRDIKYNKMKNNFENLLKFNRPLFEKTFLEEIKEALDKTKISIPANYDKYVMIMNFDSQYYYNMASKLLNSCQLYTEEYMTPTKYKKWAFEKVKDYVSEQENNYLIDYFEYSFDYRNHYYHSRSSNPIEIKFCCRYEKIKKTENKTHSNKLHKLLIK
jgi:hypothetical protein